MNFLFLCIRCLKTEEQILNNVSHGDFDICISHFQSTICKLCAYSLTCFAALNNKTLYKLFKFFKHSLTQGTQCTFYIFRYYSYIKILLLLTS